MTAGSPSPTMHVDVPLKVKGTGLSQMTRRTRPEIRSGIPGTALKSRSNWMPLTGKTGDCRHWVCGYNEAARGRYPTMTTPTLAAIGRPHSPAHRALYYGLLAV